MNKEALKLPDYLLVRYYRSGEIQQVHDVEEFGTAKKIHVHLKTDAGDRHDYWRDLGGGIGFVPDLPD